MGWNALQVLIVMSIFVCNQDVLSYYQLEIASAAEMLDCHRKVLLKTHDPLSNMKYFRVPTKASAWPQRVRPRVRTYFLGP